MGKSTAAQRVRDGGTPVALDVRSRAGRAFPTPFQQLFMLCPLCCQELQVSSKTRCLEQGLIRTLALQTCARVGFIERAKERVDITRSDAARRQHLATMGKPSCPYALESSDGLNEHEGATLVGHGEAADIACLSAPRRTLLRVLKCVFWSSDVEAGYVCTERDALVSVHGELCHRTFLHCE
jgi:hypothetical protein